MFENPSSIKKIVGNLSPSQKEWAMIQTMKAFKEQGFDPDIERRPTEKEAQMIDKTNEATNAILARFSLPKCDIPKENIHIIDNESVWNEKAGGLDAFYSQEAQAIAIKDPDRIQRFENKSDSYKNIVLKEELMHEEIHFKTFNALQKPIGGIQQKDSLSMPKITGFRCGLSSFSRSGKSEHFDWLDEGITHELVKREMRRLVNTDFFSAEENQEMLYYKSPYREYETKIINTLTNGILEKSGDKYKNEQEVFYDFSGRMLHGDIKGARKMIDDAFGNGTMQKIEAADEEDKLPLIEEILAKK